MYSGCDRGTTAVRIGIYVPNRWYRVLPTQECWYNGDDIMIKVDEPDERRIELKRGHELLLLPWEDYPNIPVSNDEILAQVTRHQQIITTLNLIIQR